MELNVYHTDGRETGRTIALEESIFGIEPNDHVIWLDVRRVQANGRQGTHKTKERSDVRGSRRKLYRQKGTGLARAGDAKSPIRKTGGRAHGPRPRSYTLNLNKKTKRLARRSAFAYKQQEEAIHVVETLDYERPDTRALTGLIEALELADQKVLVLTAENNLPVYRSSTNLDRVSVQEARNASTVDILNADAVVIEEKALDVLNEVLAGAASAEVA